MLVAMIEWSDIVIDLSGRSIDISMINPKSCAVLDVLVA